MLSEQEEREKAHFDEMGLKHKSWWGNLTRAGQIRQDIRGELAALWTGMQVGSRVLEVGCSAGEYTRRLVKTRATVIGLDLSFELIKLASDSLCNENVYFEVGTVEGLPFAADCFDAVVGNAVLHHLNLDMALPEIRRVLQEGGRIFFAEPNLLNPQVFLQRKVKWIGKVLQDSPDETAFYRWQMEKSLVAHGFKNIRVHPFDFLHPLTPKGLIPIVRRLGNVLEATPLIKEIAGSLLISAEK